MGKINITYKQSELYERLVDEYEIFDHYYEVLVFLAVVGYREGEVRRENYKGTSEGIDSDAGLQNVRSRDLFHTVAACLAFQDTGDPEALVDPEEHKRVLAQYAAGGLAVADEEFGDVSGDPVDAVVDFIKSRRPNLMDGELETIVEAFDEEMMI